MPDDVAIDKVLVLERLGATVERVRPASIIDENQFVVSTRSWENRSRASLTLSDL